MIFYHIKNDTSIIMDDTLWHTPATQVINQLKVIERQPLSCLHSDYSVDTNRHYLILSGHKPKRVGNHWSSLYCKIHFVLLCEQLYHPPHWSLGVIPVTLRQNTCWSTNAKAFLLLSFWKSCVPIENCLPLCETGTGFFLFKCQLTMVNVGMWTVQKQPVWGLSFHYVR